MKKVAIMIIILHEKRLDYQIKALELHSWKEEPKKNKRASKSLKVLDEVMRLVGSFRDVSPFNLGQCSFIG